MQDRDRDRGRKMMNFGITLCTVHTTHGQGLGTIMPIPVPVPVLVPVLCSVCEPLWLQLLVITVGQLQVTGDDPCFLVVTVTKNKFDAFCTYIWMLQITLRTWDVIRKYCGITHCSSAATLIWNCGLWGSWLMRTSSIVRKITKTRKTCNSE